MPGDNIITSDKHRWTVGSQSLGEIYESDAFKAMMDLGEEPVDETQLDEHSKTKSDIAKGNSVTKKSMSKYLEQVRKTRHLTQDERKAIHKPKSDGKLSMDSVNVDDIVPV